LFPRKLSRTLLPKFPKRLRSGALFSATAAAGDGSRLCNVLEGSVCAVMLTAERKSATKTVKRANKHIFLIGTGPFIISIIVRNLEFKCTNMIYCNRRGLINQS